MRQTSAAAMVIKAAPGTVTPAAATAAAATATAAEAATAAATTTKERRPRETALSAFLTATVH